MLKPVELSNYMVEHPVTVKPYMTIYEAAHLILTHKVSGVLVVDDNKNLLGMLSELDCLRAIMDDVYNGYELGATRVEDFMTTDVETNDPHDDITAVAASMLDHKHRRRPVVKDGRLLGQVTCRQILKAVKEFGGPPDPAEQR